MSRPDAGESLPFLPYSRPAVDEADIAAVAEALRSPMISQGDRLAAFERAFGEAAGARFAVAYSSGTAALHGLCLAAGLGPDDDVIVPALTFAGTANAVRYTGARPVFADIEPDTCCLDPVSVEARLTPDTRAILAVDFAGHPADYDALRALADAHGLLLLADAAHSPGGRYRGRPVGSLADATAFSFNPVKNMTSGEGGMVTTDDPVRHDRLQMARSHGMTRDPALLEDEPPGGWYYEQQFLGFNYKLSELHAALGLSQLSRLDAFNVARRRLAAVYDEALAGLPLRLPVARPDVEHTCHLYVIRLEPEPGRDRAALFAHLRSRGLGVQVHYIPVPLHPDYRRLGYSLDECPETARYYERALSLPLHPAMTAGDQERVIEDLRSFFG